jgi:two-component system, OmpR family, sensor histidine kinase MtrB
MEISRLDAGVEPVQRDLLNLSELVTSSARAHGARAGAIARGVTVTTDARRLGRVLANLIGNAIEHAGDAEVSLRVDGDAALVDVADRGPGIAPEHLPHIFERFYKADVARASSGSGLGLAIARENARLLGGDVSVRSEVGRGSRFTLRLPVAEPLPSRNGAVERLSDDTAVSDASAPP